MMLWTSPAGASRAATIMIGTDLHHLADELKDDGSAFLNLMEKADGKLTQYSGEIIDAFIDEAIRQRPDLVLLPGDLTFNGEKISLEDLTGRLGVLLQEGIPVAVLPGNHDLEYQSARRFSGDQMFLTDTISAEDFALIFRDFTYEEYCRRAQVTPETYPEPDALSFSYVWPLCEDLWLLCVDVNTAASPGKLTQETYQWAENVLKEAAGRGVKVIGVSHQNLLIHNSVFYDGFRMGGAKALQELFQKYHVTLHLSGHMHLQHIARDGGITDIATSALTVTPLHYGLLTIEDGQWYYDAKELPVGPDEETGDLPECAEQWFDHCTELKMEAQLQNAKLTETEKAQLISQSVDLNRAYFTGHMERWPERKLQALLKKWQSAGPAGFMQVYLISILKDKGGSALHADGRMD